MYVLVYLHYCQAVSRGEMRRANFKLPHFCLEKSGTGPSKIVANSKDFLWLTPSLLESVASSLPKCTAHPISRQRDLKRSLFSQPVISLAPGTAPQVYRGFFGVLARHLFVISWVECQIYNYAPMPPRTPFAFRASETFWRLQPSEIACQRRRDGATARTRTTGPVGTRSCKGHVLTIILLIMLQFFVVAVMINIEGRPNEPKCL